MLGNAIVGLLILAALVGAYSGGYHRGKNGLGLWPFTVGKSGIHRQPLVVFALACALSLSACSKRAASWTAPDSTVAADSERHEGGDQDRDHDKGKHKDKKHPHEDAARP